MAIELSIPPVANCPAARGRNDALEHIFSWARILFNKRRSLTGVDDGCVVVDGDDATDGVDGAGAGTGVVDDDDDEQVDNEDEDGVTLAAAVVNRVDDGNDWDANGAASACSTPNIRASPLSSQHTAHRPLLLILI